MTYLGITLTQVTRGGGSLRRIHVPISMVRSISETGSKRAPAEVVLDWDRTGIIQPIGGIMYVKETFDEIVSALRACDDESLEVVPC